MSVPESARQPGRWGCGFGPVHAAHETKAESEHGQCSRPPRTCWRTPSGARQQRRVGERPGQPRRSSGQTGPGSPSGGTGNGDLLEHSTGTGQPTASGWFGEATGHARRLRAASGTSPSGEVHATEWWWRSRRNWGHPNWIQRSRFRTTPGPRARATGPAGNGASGSRPGNRCRVRKAASPAAPQGETGDVNRSRRRLTPDHRPVVDLSTRAAPEGAQAKASSADRGAYVFPPTPPIPPRPATPPNPKNPAGVALSATPTRHFGS